MAGSARKKDNEVDNRAEVKIAVRNLQESLAVECPVQEPIIEGLLNRGEIGILAARPGTGKSPLIAQAITSVAAHVPFLGLSTVPGRVLLIDVESQPQDYREILRRQWEALDLATAQVAPCIDMFIRGVPDDPNSQELERILRCPNDLRWQWVENLQDRGGYDLIVVDTILTFSPFKSGDEEKVRELYASLSTVTRKPSHPAALGTVHLRKRDRKAKVPRLIDDPMSWTEEILGSIVWSASADVRLGLEALDDDRVVLTGYRRGRGELSPLIIEQRRDEHGDALVWDRCSDDLLAPQVLTPHQLGYFQQVPIGKDFTWQELLDVSEAPKSSMSRLKTTAIKAGLLDYDPIRAIYRRLK